MMKNFSFLFLIFFLVSLINNNILGAEPNVSKTKIPERVIEMNTKKYIIEFYSKDISKPTLILDPEKQNIYYIGSGGIYYEFKENENYRKVIQYLPQYEFKKFTNDINEVIGKIKETGEVVVFFDNEADFWYPVFNEIKVKEK